MEKLIGPEDDNFHPPRTNGWWEHETQWYWFFAPERKLGGWSYHYVRPNIGVSGGGVLIFDETAWHHVETPYYTSYWNQPLPESKDLRDCRWPSGSHIKVIEPMRRYHLTFKDRDILSYDLDWTAIMEPWVAADGDPPLTRHIDQHGHVTGELILHGERIAIDCLAMRDRSWHHLRPEGWKDQWGGGTWASAAASRDLSFLGAGPSGFLVQDGVRAALVEGKLERERDPQHGFMRKISVDAIDELGRKLVANGESVSRMAMPIPGVHGVVWTSLVKYTLNGVACWGEDQDAWPINLWSAMRREQKGLHDVRLARGKLNLRG
ncbi:MAG: hypothetical protein ABW034_14195 [Steroidobacteraceae bacterium]